MARVLVVDDEEDIREALRFLLEDAGYDVIAASSLDDALALIERESVQLILSDLFIGRRNDAQAMLQKLRQRAAPTPVGLVTAWSAQTTEALQADFAFVVAKPFDIDQLLTQVAASLALPLTEEQQRQALVVRQYFAALTARDWDALIGLCTDDVIYILPGPGALAGTQVGKQAFRAYTEETFAQFLDARFEDVHVYATPSGLASRYRGTWRMPEWERACLDGRCALPVRGRPHQADRRQPQRRAARRADAAGGWRCATCASGPRIGASVRLPCRMWSCY